MSMQSFVEYHPLVKVICLFSQSCFNVSVGLALFSFTGFGSVVLGITQLDEPLTNLEIGFLFFVVVLLSAGFAVLGGLSASLLKGLNFKDINTSMNT